MELSLVEKKILGSAAKVAALKYGVSVNAIRQKSGVGENIPMELKHARGCLIYGSYKAGARQKAAAHYISFPNSNATFLRKWYQDITPSSERAEVINLIMDRI